MQSTVCLAATFLAVMTVEAATPPAPTVLEASDRAFGNQISLSWDHVRGATTYRLFRAPSTDFSRAETIGTTASITFDDPVGRGQTLYYWIRAENADGAGPTIGPARGGTSTAAPFDSSDGIPIESPPPGNPITGAKVYLGKTMFWDEQLSSTRTTACGTCHRFRAGGTDPRAIHGDPATTHPGPDGVYGNDDDVTGSRGVPSSGADGLYRWSARFGIREQVTPRRALSILDTTVAPGGLGWDGRFSTRFADPETGAPVFTTHSAVESQAFKPLLDSVQMGHEGRTAADVVQRLRESKPLALASSIPTALARWIEGRTYADLFAEAFGDPAITPARIAMAIASYERTLKPDRTPAASPETITAHPGFFVFFSNGCTQCHRPPVFLDGSFRATGVRPTAEDPGRAEVTGIETHQGAFRVPGLRGVGLRTAFQHNGGFGSLREVIDFYNRGGDFPAPLKHPLIRSLSLTEQQKRDLESFLRTMTTDRRLLFETGPIFDRPLLYSESARVPALEGSGVAANGRVPEAIALEPAFAGNPSFTVGVTGVPPIVPAVLIIHETDPGSGAIPAQASFLRREITTSAGTPEEGFASVSVAIPDDPALVGKTLFGRWYVAGGVSRAFRFTVFQTSTTPASPLVSVHSASLAKGPAAPDSMATAYGVGLSDATIRIQDRIGVQFTATTYFSSQTQVNFVVPPGVAEGPAVIEAMKGGVLVAEGTLDVAKVAPGLFAANATGTDAAAAQVIYYRSDGTPAGGRSASTFNPVLQAWVPDPIDLQTADIQAFLVIYGSGIRKGSVVQASIGGEAAEAVYAGPQGRWEGLDQINIRIPRSLAGRGEVDVYLTVDGIRTNALRVAFR